MQRVTALVVLLVSLLYLALLDAGNRSARAQDSDKPSPAEDAQALEPAPQPTGNPHIALLLPTESSAFGKAADAVRRGVLEAYRVQPSPLPIIVYATGDDPSNVAKRYRSAVDAQARVVIGPLTRSAVTTLVQSNAATVPTLALNSADAASASHSLYFFGMQTENEARQMAELAATQGHKRALVVYGKGQLTQRLAQTFMTDWRTAGHEVAREVQFSGDVAELAKLRDQLGTLAADCAFVALEAQQAKLARAYIAPTLPIYATSLINTGNDAIARLDLNGIAFADMPWLLSADDPAVLAYTHPEAGQLNFGGQLVIDPTKGPVFEARVRVNMPGAALVSGERWVVGLCGVHANAQDVLDNVTIKELAAIYSPTFTLWSDINPAWPKEKIQRFSPGTDSGTFDYFVEAIFAKDKKPILASNPQLTLFLVTGLCFFATHALPGNVGQRILGPQ